MPTYLYYVAMCNVTFHCPQRPLEVSLNSKERLSLLKTAQKELHHDDDGALAQIPCVLRPDAATKKICLNMARFGCSSAGQTGRQAAATQKFRMGGVVYRFFARRD